MTGTELYQTLRRLYTQKGGERFFAFPLFWSCMAEKFGFPASFSFSEHRLPVSTQEALMEAAHRVLEGYPLQYELGHWEFRGRDYLCRPQVLIPREDTALLCQLCERRLPPEGQLLDFCCGSGIVGISVLQNRPDCRGIACDLSAQALALTEDNARLHGVSHRLQIRSLDLFSPLVEELLSKEAISLFAANPPYIPSAQLATLEDNVRQEPALALDGGEDGLRFYRRILSLALAFPKICFACEIGYDQRRPLEELFDKAGKTAAFYRDESGNDRCFLLNE